jgi:hypothetical protein
MVVELYKEIRFPNTDDGQSDDSGWFLTDEGADPIKSCIRKGVLSEANALRRLPENEWTGSFED